MIFYMYLNQLNNLFLASKRSFHVLKMLFNYLKYYDMVKKDVCNTANGLIAEYDQALNENNKLVVKIKTIKKQTAQVICRYIIIYVFSNKFQVDVIIFFFRFAVR